ncbi:MAG: DUF4430 domain-containing protein [Clostridia bacterium]|nr:DUF4430 domain-containing protein [Clostridia bacterium]
MKRTWWTVAAGYLLLLLVIGGVLLFGRPETVDEHYLYSPEEIPEGAETVTLSVDCLALADHLDALPAALQSDLPEGLVYLSATRFLYREGMTAFDLLLHAERPARLRIAYSGLAGNYYVSSINDLAEFSAGNESGWIVLVNGVFIDRSASAVELSPGDVVEWKYTVYYGDVLPPELLNE